MEPVVAPILVVKEDIQSIKDAISILKELAGSVQAILADGKIGIGDIKELPGLLSGVNSLVQAVKGALPELKELDALEFKEVMVEVVELVAFVWALFVGDVK